MKRFLDIEELLELNKEKKIAVRNHPDFVELGIASYTKKFLYGVRSDEDWTETMLKMRGIIFHLGTGEVLAHSFDKFFNSFEVPSITDKIKEQKLYSVAEKADGSIITGFSHRGENVWASKGSFTSEQALKAKEIFDSVYGGKVLPEGFTFTFEVIYPENRIVVDYGSDVKLVLLGIRDKFGDQILGSATLSLYMKMFGLQEIEVIKEFETDSFDTIEDAIDYYKVLADRTENFEGYILISDKGERLKAKSDTYVEKHRIRLGFSDSLLYQHFLDGTEDVLLREVPEEFEDRAKTVFSELHDLQEYYFGAEEDAEVLHAGRTRKEFAMSIKALDVDKTYKSLLFVFASEKEGQREEILKHVKKLTVQKHKESKVV